MGSTRLHGFCVCIAKCDSTAILVCGAADANSTTAIMVVITNKCANKVPSQCNWSSCGQLVKRRFVKTQTYTYIRCCDQCKQVQVPAKAKWIDVLLELLRLSVRCILIRCQYQQKGSSPTGNRKPLSLLANDDATCFLAFAHA